MLHELLTVLVYDWAIIVGVCGLGSGTSLVYLNQVFLSVEGFADVCSVKLGEEVLYGALNLALEGPILPPSILVELVL